MLQVVTITSYLEDIRKDISKFDNKTELHQFSTIEGMLKSYSESLALIEPSSNSIKDELYECQEEIKNLLKNLDAKANEHDNVKPKRDWQKNPPENLPSAFFSEEVALLHLETIHDFVKSGNLTGAQQFSTLLLEHMLPDPKSWMKNPLPKSLDELSLPYTVDKKALPLLRPPFTSQYCDMVPLVSTGEF